MNVSISYFEGRFAHPSARIILLGCVLFPAIYWPLQVLLVLALLALVYPRHAQALVGDGLSAIRLNSPGPWVLPYAIAVVFAIAYGFTSGLPTSDGLRHIVSHQVGYDWTSHYDHDQFYTPWSWWIGFEYVAGAIHRATGGDTPLTANILQALTSCIVLLGLARAFAVLLPSSVSMQCLLLAIAIPLLQPRLVGARPEALMLFLIPAALWMPRRIWLPVALVLSPAYWFSPVYGIACLLFPSRSRRDLALNLSVGILYCLGAVTFWFWYSGGEYFQIRTLLGDAISDQDFKVDELRQLVFALVNYAVMPALLVFGTSFYLGIRNAELVGDQAAGIRSRLIAIIGVALFFCAPNYARYYAIISLLLLLAAAVLLQRTSRPLTALLLCILAVSGLFFNLARMHTTPPEELLDEGLYSVPVGSRILTPFSVDAYLATATNPHSSVTPIFDPGMVTKEARPALNALIDGDFPTCNDLVGRFDYLAESRVKGAVPECLQLIRFSDSHRLWRVVAP